MPPFPVYHTQTRIGRPITRLIQKFTRNGTAEQKPNPNSIAKIGTDDIVVISRRRGRRGNVNKRWENISNKIDRNGFGGDGFFFCAIARISNSFFFPKKKKLPVIVSFRDFCVGVAAAAAPTPRNVDPSHTKRDWKTTTFFHLYGFRVPLRRIATRRDANRNYRKHTGVVLSFFFFPLSFLNVTSMF